MPDRETDFQPKLLGLKKAARALDVSVWTLIDWARKGRIVTVKLGRRRMLSVAELERLAREGV